MADEKERTNPATSTYEGVDMFVSGIGTVRECVDCHALLAGGPTRCSQCVKRWVRAANAVERALAGAFFRLYWRSPALRRIFR